MPRGPRGIVDMNALVHSNQAGVFASIADPDRFALVFILDGVVAGRRYRPRAGWHVEAISTGKICP
jgi:hypothetical protein